MLDELILVMLLALAAGLSIPLGAGLARWFSRRHRQGSEFEHAVLAFGGGALIAAVGLVLVPQGMEALPLWAAALAFGGGGLLFCWLDHLFATRVGRAGTFLAMLADFLPEAVAMGALCAIDRNAALLLAGIIALQNLPEGFAAYRERAVDDQRPALWPFLAVVPLGPLAAAAGLWLLADQPAVTGGLMLVGGAGILYLTFQDVAPQAHLDRHWTPTLGAVAGFLLAAVGQGLVGH